MSYFSIGNSFALPNKGHDVLLQFSHETQVVGILCDGVSSSFEPKFGATEVNRVISNTIKEQLALKQAPRYIDIYEDAMKQLLQQKEAAGRTNQNGQSWYATTAITAVIDEYFAEFSYVGNGAILEIRQDWFALPTQLPTPWGVTNYLNPHSRFVEGQNRLTRTLQAKSDYSYWKPDIVSLTQAHAGGSYFLICTDGLYSSDELATAWGPDKDYYIVESRRLLIFLELLRHHHVSCWEQRQQFAEELYTRLESEQLVTDDLSFILFVPEP